MDQLERECRSYTRYLAGCEPPEYAIKYAIAKYRDFHRRSDALADLKCEPFDRFLVETSARGPFWARLASSYAGRFRKSTAVRKKLIVALAILECTPPVCDRLDAVDPGGPAGAIARMGIGAVRYAACLLVSMLLFTPVRLGMAFGRKPRAVAVLER